MEMDSISARIPLRDGNTMPLFGLGCWAMGGNTAYNAVTTAVDTGYRLFDTAQFYDNEQIVGKALIDSGLPRNEYFVVTKLSPGNHGYQSAKINLKKCLDYLGFDYVDLFLIHSPHGGQNIETWKAFVELKEQGLTKSIGVSNFNIQHLEAMRAAGLEIPAVNQFELHPWNQYKETVRYCRENNIAVMGYCPLARGHFFDSNKCTMIDNLSETYKKTRAQILLKWAVQSGFITIPKSENKERIKENGSIFGWTLSEEDMSGINSLDEKVVVGAWNVHMRSKWQG